MVLLKEREALERQIQNLNKQIEQKQKAEQLYQQKIKSIKNQLLEKIRNLEKDLQNEKNDNVKIKEKLNILEAISNKPKKEVSTDTNLNWEKR